MGFRPPAYFSGPPRLWQPRSAGRLDCVIITAIRFVPVAPHRRFDQRAFGMVFGNLPRQSRPSSRPRAEMSDDMPTPTCQVGRRVLHLERDLGDVVTVIGVVVVRCRDGRDRGSGRAPTQSTSDVQAHLRQSRRPELFPTEVVREKSLALYFTKHLYSIKRSRLIR